MLEFFGESVISMPPPEKWNRFGVINATTTRFSRCPAMRMKQSSRKLSEICLSIIPTESSSDRKFKEVNEIRGFIRP